MKLRIGQWTSILLVIILLLSGANLSLFIYSQTQAEKSERSVLHTYNVIQESTELLSYLKDAETGQRGYILTLNPSYLEPYETGTLKATNSVELLSALTKDNPSQQLLLSTLEQQIAKKLDELQETITLTEQGRRAAALKIVNTDLGKQIMDDIRHSLDTFMAEEKQLLKVRDEYHQAYKAKSRHFVFSSMLLLCVVLIFYAFFLRKKIINPLLKLTFDAINFSKNLHVFEHKKSGITEIRALADAFKRMSEEIKVSMTELNVQKSLSEQASKAKSQFLANMSHEVRTPINGVYGSLQLLAQKRFSDHEEYKKLVDKSIFSCRSLLTIINDILDFSKIEAGKLTLEESAFNFEDIVNQIIFTLQPEVQEKGIRLTAHKGQNFKDGWLGDAIRVQQICLNLLSNSVKFTEQGHIEFIYDVIECEKKPCLKVQVTDTGIGMSQKTLDKLFERFEQADTSITRKYGGTGLGIAITKQLVDLMQGKIQVLSEESKGTVFTILLPLKKTEHVAPEEKAKADYRVPELSDMKILLAEDNKLNQTIFEAMLEDTRANILIAKNGKEATELVEDFKPDLIFMDIQMPVMDGIEAFHIIKKSMPTLPIIALTANVMDSDIQQYDSVGFDGVISKPIEIKKLYLALNSYKAETIIGIQA